MKDDNEKSSFYINIKLTGLNKENNELNLALDNNKYRIIVALIYDT